MERLPKWLFCIPFVIQWLALAVRYRSLTLPSVLNDGIETGGLAGESKLATLQALEARHADWVAHAVGVTPGDDAVAVRQSSGIDYPLIAKPDIGWCGYGVWLIESDRELKRYAAIYPPNGTFILQRYVELPNEAGLMYVRRPGEPTGKIIALTMRHPPHVVGDGISTIEALVVRDPRLRPNVETYRAGRSGGTMARVLAPDERVYLTTIASIRVGSRYEDATTLVTAALERKVDEIARTLPGFHFGRFDVRFESTSALQEAEFAIMELNGAGAEAIHFWDPDLSLAQSFAGVFAKQRLIFEMADMMRRRGAVPVGALRLAQAWLRQQRLIAHYPLSN